MSVFYIEERGRTTLVRMLEVTFGSGIGSSSSPISINSVVSRSDSDKWRGVG